MRGLRGDSLSIVAVLAVPLGLAAVFPRGAIGFSASDDRPSASAPSSSIVFLDAVSVARAVNSTRILSKHEKDTSGTGFLSAELPEMDAVPAIPISFRSRPKTPAVVESGVSSFLPSRRAAAPIRISAEKDGDSLPFPRNELLKLN